MRPAYYFFSNEFIHFFMKYTQLHNVQFKPGSEFVKILQNYEDNTASLFNTFRAAYKNGGLFLFSNKETALHGFVLDMDNIRDKKRYEENVLSIIEKYFRIYIKLDQNYPLSSSEVHINGTTNYIVNPFSYSPTDGFVKYIINISPDTKRDEVRNIKLFLNITDGTGNLDYNNFSKTNYRKVKETFVAVRQLTESKTEDKVPVNPDDTLVEFESEKQLDTVINYIGFDKWKPYLTQKQQDIIFSDTLGPIKITGPAGAGKTLSLILKALHLAKKNSSEGKPLKIGFICHSEAMRQYIESILAIDGSEFLEPTSSVSISVTTLIKWCCDYAIKSFSLDDCLEVDSADSKLMQQMMIESAVEKFMNQHYKTFSEFLSDGFRKFMEESPRPKLIEAIRNEISLFIKGPDINSVDDYKKGAGKGKVLPLIKDEDFSAIYQIFEMYQTSLTDINKYDIDDVSSVALGFLTKAIWKRNRRFDGFDTIFVDEVHLYDFSEIAILKYMLKEAESNHIISAEDISQSSGDISIVRANVNFANGDKNDINKNQLDIVFRSSQPIINLTKFLFDDNLLLFSNHNPLQGAQVFKKDEELLPSLTECVNDSDLISSLTAAHELRTNAKGNSLVVFTDYGLENALVAEFERNRIPYVSLKNRNDYATIKAARANCKVVIGYIDFIGGLEFDNVFILGFDTGRVPPEDVSMSTEFFTHIWFRKMYVAFTRARKMLRIYSNIEKGEHEFLQNALRHRLIEKQ